MASGSPAWAGIDRRHRHAEVHGLRFPRVGGDRPSTHACSRTSQGVAQPFRLGVDRYRRSRESAFMHCPEGNCMEVSPRLLHPVRCIKGPTRAVRLEIRQ